jgi:hypothetical protein
MIGFVIAFVLFWIANVIFPPPGTDISEPFDDNEIALENFESPLDGQSIDLPSKETVVTKEKDVTHQV